MEADKAEGLEFGVYEVHAKDDECEDFEWDRINPARWRKRGTFDSRKRANKKAWQVADKHYSDDEEDDDDDEDRMIRMRLNDDGLFEETIYNPKKAPKGTDWTRVWVQEE